MLTAFISADQNDQVVLKDVRNGAYQIVFFTPEMLLLSKQWRSLLKSEVYHEHLHGLIIDEAHTVKKW